jgi:hypothetical protein
MGVNLKVVKMNDLSIATTKMSYLDIFSPKESDDVINQIDRDTSYGPNLSYYVVRLTCEAQDYMLML